MVIIDFLSGCSHILHNKLLDYREQLEETINVFLSLKVRYIYI